MVTSRFVDYVPVSVFCYWLEARQALGIKAYRAVGLLCRSVIEALTAGVDIDFRGVSRDEVLVRRVRKLVNDGVVQDRALSHIDVLGKVNEGMAYVDLSHVLTAFEAMELVELVEFLVEDLYVAPRGASSLRLP